jgi:hypothetical protein
MARLVVGGSSYRRSATERFRYRLDTLLDLLDIELALEEEKGEVWYMTVCAQCDHVPVAFEKDADRVEWANHHVDDTNHIVVKFEEPR